MKRVFILGAGFSKPAGMPLATDLLPLLTTRLQIDEMRQWLDCLCRRLVWLSRSLNIEQVFHDAHFDIEVHRLKQHLVRVGRRDGPGTPWNSAMSISHWLSCLEDALRDVILEKENQADLAPITRWAETVDTSDTVVTFNYDTLVERALTKIGKPWHHATGQETDGGIAVCKLHGSIDWIVAERCNTFSKLDLIFDKPNANRSQEKTGHIEDDCRLWRFPHREQLQKWFESRDLQSESWKTVGIAGLGPYKQLHQIPGLGAVWAYGMRRLIEADRAAVVGFSMSDFDSMAQMQFAEVAQRRERESSPLRVTVVDPAVKNEEAKNRFKRVFRCVDFDSRPHEEVDWNSL